VVTKHSCNEGASCYGPWLQQWGWKKLARNSALPMVRTPWLPGSTL